MPVDGRIDVHHHIVPPGYRRALADAGLVDPIPGVDYPDWSVEQTLAMMDRRGIATAIVSITEPGITFGGPERARELARAVNEFMAALMHEHPGRFGAFAVLPLPDLDASVAELRHALDVLGLDGVGLMTHYQGIYLGDPTFEPLMAELAMRTTPTFVHPSAPPARDQPSFGLPPSLYEFTFDTTRMVANLLYGGTLERYPGLALILSHAGGTLPMLAHRLTYGPTIGAHLAARAPRDLIGTLRRLRYDTAMSASAPALAALTALVEPSQILFGTDFPFMPESTTVETIGGLASFAGFGESDRDAIDRGNALGLFPRLRDAALT
ncbi:MAG: amidohydrolase family protein [Solirubrobacteraceae bacterium]